MRPGDFLDRITVLFRHDGLRDDYRQVFDSDAGRRVLADLCRWAEIMQIHEGWPSDALQCATGKRATVLYILAKLRMQPQDLQQFSQMEAIND